MERYKYGSYVKRAQTEFQHCHKVGKATSERGKWSTWQRINEDYGLKAHKVKVYPLMCG